MSELIALVPYLLGFVPSDSAVAVMLREGTVLLTARSDLDEPRAGGRPGSVAGLAIQLARVADVHGADGMVLVVFCRSRTTARSAWSRIRAVGGLPPVHDAVHVRPDRPGRPFRWVSLLDGESGEVAVSAPAVAEAVYAGLSVVEDRAAAVRDAEGPGAERLAELAAVTATERERVRGWTTDERVAEMRRLTAAWFVPDADPDPTDLPAPELVRIGLLCGTIAARDAVLMEVDVTVAAAHRTGWARVVAVLPDGDAAGPLCLLGLSAWLTGDGALLVRCLERAETCDPGYRLTALLSQITDGALHPSVWRRLSDHPGGEPDDVLDGAAGPGRRP